MKKVKFLAISLVISNMLMGVGYAAWTSKADITTNASTGNFSVNLEADNSGTVTYKSDAALTKDNEDKTYAKVVYDSVSNSAAGISFKDLYPGSTAIGDIKVTNKSTLPIKYGTIDYSISGAGLGNVLSNDRIRIYVIINGNEYLLRNSIGKVVLPDNSDSNIGITDDENTSHIKVKVVVPSSVNDSFGSGLQIQLTPTFEQFNS